MFCGWLWCVDCGCWVDFCGWCVLFYGYGWVCDLVWGLCVGDLVEGIFVGVEVWFEWLYCGDLFWMGCIEWLEDYYFLVFGWWFGDCWCGCCGDYEDVDLVCFVYFDFWCY